MKKASILFGTLILLSTAPAVSVETIYSSSLPRNQVEKDFMEKEEKREAARQKAKKEFYAEESRKWEETHSGFWSRCGGFLIMGLALFLIFLPMLLIV